MAFHSARSASAQASIESVAVKNKTFDFPDENGRKPYQRVPLKKARYVTVKATQLMFCACYTPIHVAALC